MGKYKRLTYHDRMKIEAYKNAGYSQADIARILRINPSTICRELRKGAYMRKDSFWRDVAAYSSDLAQQRAEFQMTSKGKELKIADDYALADFIESKICDEKYSPDAVINLIRTTPEISKQFKIQISTPTLYRYIRKGLFLRLTTKNLPYYKKRTYKKVVRKQKRSSAGTSIEKRPDAILDRSEFGDWEMDTVKGRLKVTRGCLLVLTERKTRKELIFLLPNQKAESVVSVLDTLEHGLGNDFGRIFRTITVDNGVEFSDFYGMQESKLADRDRTRLFYCHAYSSYERGSNENANRIIRRHAPKGTNLDDLSHDDVRYIQDWMNNYPRKLLGWKTANNLFREELDKLGIGACQFF